MNHNDAPQYPIRVAAQLIGVSVHTLRMYEREGLIIPFKDGSKHRRYSQTDIDRLRCLRDAINRDKISIEGIKRIFALIPCWRVIGCPDSERISCPAFNGHTKPCWMFNHKNICSRQECRTCTVYKDLSNCDAVKGILRNYFSTHLATMEKK